MALSMAQKLKQAAEARMAETAHETNARLDDMDAKAREAVTQVVPFKQRTETSEPIEASTQASPSAPQSNTTNQHHNIAQQNHISAPHPDNATPHFDTTIRQNKPAFQSSKLLHHHNTAPQHRTTSQQVNSAGQSGATPAQPTVVHVCLDAPAMVRTPAQKRMLRYFEDHGHHVSNYDKIIAETGLRYGTVRDIVDRFEKQGIIAKAPWAQGSARGILFTFHGIIRQDNPTGQFGTTAQHLNPAIKSSTTSQHHSPTPQSDISNKKDRKNLSISLETLETAWPFLARAGFGLGQLEQIERSLNEQGKPLDKMVQGLDHAEWELANGKMQDKTGQPVADPCAWVFRSLASAGYYRRPAGYVSPAEQAERDAEEEAAALAKSRENARQARFQAWRQGLCPEELQNALAGKIGGTDETWLKNVWIKRGEPQ